MEDFTKNTPQEKASVTEMAISRQAQEVQGAIVMAKRFPRDEQESIKRILGSCSRKGLAEQAEYVYPRGGTKISGPSIRLAELLAQNWGNVDYGIVELENKDGKSTLMAYAWDLETNTRITKVFTLKHWRDTKTGGYAIKDGRDIYELTANFGARRVRACILGVIPGDVVDLAVNQCRKTLASDTTPLEARVQAMLLAFKDEFGINHDQIEEYLGCSIRAITEHELIRIKSVYRSIKDGMSDVENYFTMPENKVKDVFATAVPEKEEKTQNPPVKTQKTGPVDAQSEPKTQWEIEDEAKQV